MNRRICDKMPKVWQAIILALALGLMATIVLAAPPTQHGRVLRWTGTGSNSGDVLVEATEADSVPYLGACMLVAATGSVEVLMSMNGQTWPTAALSLVDYGATDNDPVVSTAALRVYAFPVIAAAFRVRQVGATASSVVINCEMRE